MDSRHHMTCPVLNRRISPSIWEPVGTNYAKSTLVDILYPISDIWSQRLLCTFMLIAVE